VAKLAIETARTIVDVAIAGSRGRCRCLVEAMSVRLDDRFDRAYESFVVDLF
jgi:hypothetical protein